MVSFAKHHTIDPSSLCSLLYFLLFPLYLFTPIWTVWFPYQLILVFSIFYPESRSRNLSLMYVVLSLTGIVKPAIKCDILTSTSCSFFTWTILRYSSIRYKLITKSPTGFFTLQPTWLYVFSKSINTAYRSLCASIYFSAIYLWANSSIVDLSGVNKFVFN